MYSLEDIQTLHQKDLMALIEQAHQIYVHHFPDKKIQLCGLVNIKTGGCPEDCGFCNQSAHFKTALERKGLMDLDEVRIQVKKLKEQGATRCCLGAAWRKPPVKEFEHVLNMIQVIKDEGLESCITMGFLNQEQAQKLKDHGLDYYNHNIETSPDYYSEVVTTHLFQDRLDTLEAVYGAGLNICCGGIMGLGETWQQRCHFLYELTKLPQIPQSIPINRMIHFQKTKCQEVVELDFFDFLKVIALARILFPTSQVRLSGGRKSMSKSEQFLCFYAGANSMWVGDKLLTADNSSPQEDHQMLAQFGLETHA